MSCYIYKNTKIFSCIIVRDLHITPQELLNCEVSNTLRCCGHSARADDVSRGQGIYRELFTHRNQTFWHIENKPALLQDQPHPFPSIPIHTHPLWWKRAKLVTLDAEQNKLQLYHLLLCFTKSLVYKPLSSVTLSKHQK